MGDATVFTTMEIAIGVFDDLAFLRIYDPNSGFPELVVQPLAKF